MVVSDVRRLESKTSKTKLLFVIGAFTISLAAFVCQTEFTSVAYKLNFQEPLIMLWVTHGSWWLLWPLQILMVASYRTLQKRTNVKGYWKKCIMRQFNNIYHTAVLVYDKDELVVSEILSRNEKLDSSSLKECIISFLKAPAITSLIKKSFFITLVLTVAGGTWYGAMALTFPSDVTAIYNCSAFTAYAFAIPMLNESFTWLKSSSVFIAVSGVFLVAYSDTPAESYPYRLWGNLIILVGAVLYGYYEVLYKLHCCIPSHLSKVITPRRQATFANFIMGLFGLFTSIILILVIIISSITGIHKFNFFNYENVGTIWVYISTCIVSNLLFSASFLCLMALTGPVLSSVSSLLTIFLIGIVEWYIFGNKLGTQQLIGDGFIVVGFALLTYASWKEIAEGKDDDDISTYSGE